MLDKHLIVEAMENFPEVFGLKAFPGSVFCISLDDSFVNTSRNPETNEYDIKTVMLYTRILTNGEWKAFAKGTVEELQKNVVDLF